MIKFFLETVSAVFAALALLTFTASAFTFTWAVTMKWLLLGAGFAAVGGGAQLLLLFFTCRKQVDYSRPLCSTSNKRGYVRLGPKADKCAVGLSALCQ